MHNFVVCNDTNVRELLFTGTGKKEKEIERAHRREEERGRGVERERGREEWKRER